MSTPSAGNLTCAQVLRSACLVYPRELTVFLGIIFLGSVVLVQANHPPSEDYGLIYDEGFKYTSIDDLEEDWYFRVYDIGDSAANIEVSHADGLDNISLDYTLGSSGWVDLGTYSFDTTSESCVRNFRTFGYARADAIRYRRYINELWAWEMVVADAGSASGQIQAQGAEFTIEGEQEFWN